MLVNDVHVERLRLYLCNSQKKMMWFANMNSLNEDIMTCVSWMC
jgi:hypothetical protein